MTNLKILHLDAGETWRGGQAQVYQLLNGLKKYDVESALASPPGSPLLEKAGKTGFKTFAIPFKGEFDFLSAKKIYSTAKEFGADIIHIHDAKSHAVAWMASKFITHIPMIVTRRVDFEVGKNFLSRRKYLSNIFSYIAISQGVKKVLQRGGIEEERITVVHSGVDIGKVDRTNIDDIKNFRFPEEWNITSKNIVVGNVASLVDHKGINYLIEAAALIIKENSNVRFVVAGEGEDREKLEQMISAFNLDNYFYLAGFQNNIDIWIANLDIFALSSHLEGLCTSLIDAMLFGIPAIGTDTGGVPDLIINEVTGLLVPPKDSKSLANAILRLISDNEMAKQYAFNAETMVKEKFSAEKMVEGTYKVYNKILHERKKG